METRLSLAGSLSIKAISSPYIRAFLAKISPIIIIDLLSRSYIVATEGD
jgi:hypothetical protein